MFIALNILFTLLWVGSLQKTGFFSKELPKAFRIQIVLISLYLIWSGITNIRHFWWGVFHPTAYWEFFYTQNGNISPLLNILLPGLSGLSGHFTLSWGFDLTKRKSRAMKWLCITIPWLTLLDGAELYRSLQQQAQGKPVDNWVLGISLVLMISVNFWVYRFCGKHEHRELMTH